MVKKVKLISICKPKQYKTLSKIDLIENGKFSVYGANGIIGKSDKFTHENPTLMVTCRGATCGTLNISEPNSYINGNAMAFDDINEEFDLKYLYYFLLTRGFNDVISGSAQPQITRENLKNLEVLKPILEKQKQIVKILDKANELIELRKESITKLDSLAKSIFIDMFGDPVSNPKGWRVEKLYMLCNKILGGGTPLTSNREYYTDGNIPWITPKDMKKLYISNSKINITEKAIENSSAKLIPEQSLLMVIRSGILKKYLPVAINIVKTTINQDMKAFIFNSQTNNSFVMYFFKHYERYLLKKVRSVTADNLKFDDIKNIMVTMPPQDLQNKFAKIIEKIEEHKSLYEKELELLQNNFYALLQKSFQE